MLLLRTRPGVLVAAASLALLARGAAAQAIAVQLEGVNSSNGATWVTAGPADTYEVRAGTIDTSATRNPLSGRLVRWAKAPGAFLVWTFRARIDHPGVTARLEVQASSRDGEGLRYALGDRTRWDDARAGRPVPLVGAAVVNSAVRSGESFVFQIALAMRDRDKAGPRQPEIRYQAVVNSDMPVVGRPGAPQNGYWRRLSPRASEQPMQPPSILTVRP